jgi:hypothetical protein
MKLSEALEAVESKFEVYRAMVRAIAAGNISHAIVHGPPGIGKSWELNEIFDRYATAGSISWASVSGHMTALSLFNRLYEMRGKNDILVLDDCDDAFKDRIAMNILKAATDTKNPRTISWESSGARAAAQRFEYEGRIVVLSNANFEASPHLLALVDRMFFIPLQLTNDERLARVISVLQKPEPGKRIHPKADMVSCWIIANHGRIGARLTLRSAVKALQLASFTDDWEKMAEMVLGL